MALAVPAVPFTFVVHLLGIAGIIMVLIWNIDFRGGLAWESTNKNLIFNVIFSLLSLSQLLSFQFPTLSSVSPYIPFKFNRLCLLMMGFALAATCENPKMLG